MAGLVTCLSYPIRAISVGAGAEIDVPLLGRLG